MSTQHQTRTNTVTLAISALLGAGMLAGCSLAGNGSGAGPAASASTGQTGPSAGQSGPSAGATTSAAPSASAPAATSAPALLGAARAALRSGGSVHVDIADSGTQGSVNFSDDATASGGRQIVTVDGTGHATILFIAGVGYVQANAQALVAFFQVPESRAEQAAGKWIALQPGEKLGASTYDDVTAGITLSSVAGELTGNGNITLTAPTTIAGQRVVGVRAPLATTSGVPASARSVLYVTDDSLRRPVLSEVQGGGSYKYQMSFSRWGEKLQLAAPANPIPASSITPATSIA